MCGWTWCTKTIYTSAYLHLWGGKADCYTPQLNSKAIPLKLDHIIPNDELTHDTKVGGDARRCCNVQQCKCLDANLERDFCLTVSVARATHVDAGEHMVCYFQILSRSWQWQLFLFNCPLVHLICLFEYTRGLYSTILFVTLQYKHSHSQGT